MGVGTSVCPCLLVCCVMSAVALSHKMRQLMCARRGDVFRWLSPAHHLFCFPTFGV